MLPAMPLHAQSAGARPHAFAASPGTAATATPMPPPRTAPGGRAEGDSPNADTIETRLWLQEHQWLQSVLHSGANAAPTFRMPDLVSACVSLVFLHEGAPERIFSVLASDLVLRPPLTPRRRESLWRAQYELLLAVQRSPANRHPNPRFQLDHLTTACVALCQAMPGAESLVLRQSRLNMAERALRARHAAIG